MMTIIADSGATKASWRLIGDDGTVGELVTDGINAVFSDARMVTDILRDKVRPLCSGAVSQIILYVAGAVGGEVNKMLSDCVEKVFPEAECLIYPDTLGAARAVCGHNPGIACILGTGSSCCFYDGREISARVNSGGFILGDEGSGAYLGKRLLSDYLKRLMPPELSHTLEERYGVTYPVIVQKVYRESLPGRYLASFSPFIKENSAHPWIAALLRESFGSFARRNLCGFDRKYPVNLVGSVAFHYSGFICEALEKEGFSPGKILAAPIDGLVDYHLGRI